MDNRDSRVDTTTTFLSFYFVLLFFVQPRHVSKQVIFLCSQTLFFIYFLFWVLVQTKISDFVFFSKLVNKTIADDPCFKISIGNEKSTS
jgi:hypothetical protein